MFAVMFVIAIVAFLIVFRIHGKYMANIYGLDNSNPTPAETMFDGIDYCPAHPAVLVGHHFASIAGAGPIVGPIAAASMFGWLPAYLWCIVGSAFLGGPHDMGSLVASMRHDGKSIGEVIDRWIGRPGKILFLCFTIITLILVVAVFLVLSAKTFAADPIVAFVGCLYIGMAIVSGLLIYKYNTPLLLVTIVMLAIIGFATVKGVESEWIMTTFKLSSNTWDWILSGYILVASILPVWLLLQPRDYLASYFLYVAVILGAIGMIFGSSFNSGEIPVWGGFVVNNTPIWPMLFVIVACGAISGFHSLVGSGTTSKQIRKETDSIVVGYGSMLLEGVVAVIAIGTVMVTGSVVEGGPVVTFSQGLGKFASVIGIDPVLGMRLGAIAINSFLLTSLDTATRLTRYQIQELSNMKINKYVATILAVAGALFLVFAPAHDPAGNPIAAWQAIWPLFGTANQMVAALAILGVAVWVFKALKKPNKFLMIPFWFMIITTGAALLLMIKNSLAGEFPNYMQAGIASLLVVLGVLLVIQSFKAMKPKITGTEE